MDDVRNFVPIAKADLTRAFAAVEAGYPAVAPVLAELTKWLQDLNWPVAHVLAPLLASIGAPMVPHIWHVLRSDDDVWKWGILEIILPALPEDVAVEFRAELERLCYAPRLNEAREELDEQARNVLAQFNWLRGST
jgi:hypothetical protein